MDRRFQRMKGFRQMSELFSNQSSDPKNNAQRNLQGRTHYVDDDSLRFHKSRVISARQTHNGLLFAIVTSDALDFENRTRGFRYVIFDIFSTVISRTEISAAFRRSEQAMKAMWDAVNAIDAKAHTVAAIEKQRARVVSELDTLAATVAKLEV
jgi:hypothetical protein